MQEASSGPAIVNLVVCEGPLYYKHKGSWREKYTELIKCTKEMEGCMYVLKICDKKGSKPKMEIESQYILRIEVHSESISGENQLIFKVLLSNSKHPLCLYSKSREVVSNWVASLLVAVSKGRLYHVKHYSDDSTSMQHSILYLTNAYDSDTDEKELTLILSSPLDGSRIRKSWKVNVIKEIVQLNAVVKIVFCPACCKSIGQVSLEFILFVPSNNAAECLEFICQNPCFTFTSSNERTISYKSIEHDKICSQSSQNNEGPMATSIFSSSHEDSDDNVKDMESDKVKDELELHQPECQDVTVDVPHKGPVTETCDAPVETTQSESSETCDAPKEDISTTQSRSSEVKVPLPTERPRVHIYEQIPDKTSIACQADDESSAVPTPGTLHRRLVKPVGEDTATLRKNPTNIKMLPPRGSHNYDEIPHITTKNPDKASEDTKDLEIHHETPHTAHMSDDSDSDEQVMPYAVVSKPTTDQDTSESTQEPSSPTHNTDIDETLSTESCRSTSTEHRPTPIPLPRKKKSNTWKFQNSDDENDAKFGACKPEPKEMGMRPTPKPRKNVPTSSRIQLQDTIFELSEVDNYDEDQTDTRSDCIPEEEKLKPVPKPRVGGRLSSNSDEEEEYYTKLIPYQMDHCEQMKNEGYEVPNVNENNDN